MLKRVLDNGIRIFLIDDVSPEDMAMLMALYARLGESVETQVDKVYDARRVAMVQAIELRGLDGCEGSIVDSIMRVIGDNHPTARAARLHERYVAGYGHKSIADNGTTALFVEGGSMLLAKALEDTPLFNGQEMSSRAVDCGALPFADPLGTPESRALLERWRAFYGRALPLAAEEVQRRHPRRDGEDEAVYARAVHMRAFDICRGLLPFGCTTQVGWAGTLRHIGDRLGVLVEHPAAEVRVVAEGLLALCRDRYPSSGFGEASVSGTGTLTEAAELRAERRTWTRRATRDWTYVPERSDNAYGDMRYGDMRSLIDLQIPIDAAALLATRPRGALLPHVFAGFGLAHFDFLLDMGSWRDIQRHRPLVCAPALLTADHGFEPWYIEGLPSALQAEAIAFVAMQADAAYAMTADPVVRQYYLGMGFRVRTRISASLPALVYMLELRSGKAIHPTLRRRVLEMADHLRVQHPRVALHVDRDPDDWTVRRGTHVITDTAAAKASS